VTKLEKARLVELRLGGCPVCGGKLQFRNGHVNCQGSLVCLHWNMCVLHVPKRPRDRRKR
jgi:uncharacterized protein (UPF0212 family)